MFSSPTAPKAELVWLTAPDGMLYTSNRRWTLEQLPNGLWRLFDRASQMASLFTDAMSAKIEARDCPF